MPNGQRFPNPQGYGAHPNFATKPITGNEKVVQALYDHRTGTILLPSGPNGQMMQCNYTPQQMYQMYQARQPAPMAHQPYPASMPMRFPGQPAFSPHAQSLPNREPAPSSARAKKERDPDFVDLISDDEESEDPAPVVTNKSRKAQVQAHKSPALSAHEPPKQKNEDKRSRTATVKDQPAKPSPKSKRGRTIKAPTPTPAPATDSLFDGESIFSSPITQAPSPKRRGTKKQQEKASALDPVLPPLHPISAPVPLVGKRSRKSAPAETVTEVENSTSARTTRASVGKPNVVHPLSSPIPKAAEKKKPHQNIPAPEEKTSRKDSKTAQKRRQPSPSPSPEPEPESESEEEVVVPSPAPTPPRVTRTSKHQLQKPEPPTKSVPAPQQTQKSAPHTSTRSQKNHHPIPEPKKSKPTETPVNVPAKQKPVNENGKGKGKKRPAPSPSPKKAPVVKPSEPIIAAPVTKKPKIPEVVAPQKEAPKKKERHVEKKPEAPKPPSPVKKSSKKVKGKKNDSRNDSTVSILLSATFPARFSRIVEKKTKAFFATNSRKLLQCKLCPDMFGNGTMEIKQHIFKHLKEKDNLGEELPKEQQEFDEFLESQSRELIRTMRDCFFPQHGEEEDEAPIKAQVQPEETSRTPAEFLKLLERLTKSFANASKIPCQFAGCSSLISNCRGNVLERHIYSHFDKNLYKCLGGCGKSLKGIMDHWNKTHKGSTPQFLDLRGDHEQELIHITNACFPAPKNPKPTQKTEPEADDILVVDEQKPKNKDGIRAPEKFYEALKEGIEKWRNQMPLRCRYQSKGGPLCNATFPKSWTVPQFENHVLKHFGQKVFKCLECHERLISGIEDHFKTVHNKPLDSTSYKDMRHSYEKDLIVIFKRCLPKDAATGKMNAEVKRLTMQAETLQTKKPQPLKTAQLSDYPEPAELIAFAQVVVNSMRKQTPETEASDSEEEDKECKYPQCQYALEELSVQKVEEHILTHYKPVVYKCLGCECRFHSCQQAERHTCDVTKIADLRSQHQEHLLRIGRRCFPQVATTKLSVATNEIASKYAATQKEVIRRMGGRKIRCLHSSRCSYTCNVGSSQSSLLTLENHVVYHMGPLKVYQCLFCWKKLSSPTDNHFSKHHPNAEGSQKVKDLRYLYEGELVEGLRICFLARSEPAKQLERVINGKSRTTPASTRQTIGDQQNDQSYSDSDDSAWALFSENTKSSRNSSPVSDASQRRSGSRASQSSNQGVARKLQKETKDIPRSTVSTRTTAPAPKAPQRVVQNHPPAAAKLVPSHQRPTKASTAHLQKEKIRSLATVHHQNVQPQIVRPQMVKPQTRAVPQPQQARPTLPASRPQRVEPISVRPVVEKSSHRYPPTPGKSAMISQTRHVPEMARRPHHQPAKISEPAKEVRKTQTKQPEIQPSHKKYEPPHPKPDNDEIKIVGEVVKTPTEVEPPAKKNVPDVPKTKEDKLVSWGKILGEHIENAKLHAEIECDDNKCDFFTGTRSLTATVLEDHVIGKHLRRRIFQCLICGSRLQLRSTAAKHLLNKHKIKSMDTEIDDGRAKCYSVLVKELKRCFPMKKQVVKQSVPVSSEPAVRASPVEGGQSSSLAEKPAPSVPVPAPVQYSKRYGPRGPYNRRFGRGDLFNFGYSNLEQQNEFLGGLLPPLSSKPPVSAHVEGSSREEVSGMKEAEKMLEESLALLGTSKDGSSIASAVVPELTAVDSCAPSAKSIRKLNILAVSSIFENLKLFVSRLEEQAIPDVPKLNILSMQAIIGNLRNMLDQVEASVPSAEKELVDVSKIKEEKTSLKDSWLAESGMIEEGEELPELPKEIRESIRCQELIILNDDNSVSEIDWDSETLMSEEDFKPLKDSFYHRRTRKLFPSHSDIMDEIESIVSESASFLSDVEKFRKKSFEAVDDLERRGLVRRLSDFTDYSPRRHEAPSKRRRIDPERADRPNEPDESTEIWVQLFTSIIQQSSEDASPESHSRIISAKEDTEYTTGEGKDGDELEVADEILRILTNGAAKERSDHLEAERDVAGEPEMSSVEKDEIPSDPVLSEKVIFVMDSESSTEQTKELVEQALRRVEELIIEDEVRETIAKILATVSGNENSTMEEASVEESGIISALLDFLLENPSLNDEGISSIGSSDGINERCQDDVYSLQQANHSPIVNSSGSLHDESISGVIAELIKAMDAEEKSEISEPLAEEDDIAEAIADELLEEILRESFEQRQEETQTVEDVGSSTEDMDVSTDSVENVIAELIDNLPDSESSDEAETKSIAADNVANEDNIGDEEKTEEHDVMVDAMETTGESKATAMMEGQSDPETVSFDSALTETEEKRLLRLRTETALNEWLEAWLAKAIFAEASVVMERARAQKKALHDVEEAMDRILSLVASPLECSRASPQLPSAAEEDEALFTASLAERGDLPSSEIREATNNLLEDVCSHEESGGGCDSPVRDAPPSFIDPRSPNVADDTLGLDETFKTLCETSANETMEATFYDALDETPTRLKLSGGGAMNEIAEEVLDHIVKAVAVQDNSREDSSHSPSNGSHSQPPPEEIDFDAIGANSEDREQEDKSIFASRNDCISPQVDLDPSLEMDILGADEPEEESGKELIDELWANVFA